MVNTREIGRYAGKSGSICREKWMKERIMSLHRGEVCIWTEGARNWVFGEALEIVGLVYYIGELMANQGYTGD